MGGAFGSSSGSWYGSRYGCASASSQLIRFNGLKASNFSRRSMASGFALGYIDAKDSRFLNGKARM